MTDYDASQDFRSDPVVETLLANERNYIPAAGYIAIAEKGVVRLYFDLRLGEYMELANSDILWISPPREGTRRKLFIRGEASIRYVREATFRGEHAISAALRRGALSPSCRCTGYPGGAGTAERDNDPPEGTMASCFHGCHLEYAACSIAPVPFMAIWCEARLNMCLNDCAGSIILDGD